MYAERITRVKDSRNMREFWENVNFFRRVKRGKTGPIALNAWTNFYKGIFPPRFQTILEQDEIFVEELDRPFTMEELEFALNTAKLRKAAGGGGWNPS